MSHHNLSRCPTHPAGTANRLWQSGGACIRPRTAVTTALNVADLRMRVILSAETARKLVLIVEDDRKTAELLVTYFNRDGFRTLAVHDGRQAAAVAASERPAFVILDLMLPGLNGWDICREIRRTSDVPILFLTARDDETDRVLGLSLGDDYVVKPFSPREVVARVRAILRRARPVAPVAATVLTHAGLVLDLDKRRVTVQGQSVDLTPSEYTLLQALPGKSRTSISKPTTV